MTPPAGPPLEPPALVVDCLGRPCPVPVIELAKAITHLPVGALVEVWSDDPAARHDLPAWCAMRGQDYLGHRPLTDEPPGAVPEAPLQTTTGGRPPGPTAHLVRRRSG